MNPLTGSDIVREITPPAPTPKKQRKAPTRRVFGRVTTTIAGRKVRFEQTKEGLVIRVWHSKQPVKLAFTTILERSKIQFDLPLQDNLPLKKL